MANISLFVTVVYPCLECGQTVRLRQEAIQCENCSFWQHRKCNTNITRECYQRAVRGEEELQWQCVSCLMNFQIESDELPIESTRLSTFSTGEEDYPLPNEEVSILNSSVSHPNTSFVPAVAFHPDQTKEHDSSTLNGSLIQKKRISLMHILSFLFLRIYKNRHWIYPFSIHLIRIANWNVPLSSRSSPSPHRREKMF